MKINGLGRSEPASTRKTDRSKGTGDSFRIFSGHTEATAGAAPPTPLAPMNALVALQEVSDALEGKRRAVRRGTDMLDLLDDVRHGLLTGSLSETKLSSLVRVVEATQDHLTEPGLADLLGEIELRARVELAKLGRYL